MRAQLFEIEGRRAARNAGAVDEKYVPQLRQPAAQGFDLRQLGGVLDDHRDGPGIADHPQAFLRRAGRVDGHHHGAGGDDAELDLAPFRPGLRQYAHPVAGTHAQRDEAESDLHGHVA
jgi:hypothetical protein